MCYGNIIIRYCENFHDIQLFASRHSSKSFYSEQRVHLYISCFKHFRNNLSSFTLLNSFPCFEYRKNSLTSLKTPADMLSRSYFENPFLKNYFLKGIKIDRKNLRHHFCCRTPLFSTEKCGWSPLGVVFYVFSFCQVVISSFFLKKKNKTNLALHNYIEKHTYIWKIF